MWKNLKTETKAAIITFFVILIAVLGYIFLMHDPDASVGGVAIGITAMLVTEFLIFCIWGIIYSIIEEDDETN